MNVSSHDDPTQFSAEHQARRLAMHDDSRKPPPPKRRFVRDLVLIGGIIAVAALLAPFADTPTPGYPEAQAAADGLNAAHRSVMLGDASLEAAAAVNDLSVYEFEFKGREVSVLAQPQPTADGTCYGIRMGGGIATVAVEFAPTDACVPQGPSTFEAIGSWEDLLPSERMTPWWYVPAMILFVGSALVLATGVVLKLISR